MKKMIKKRNETIAGVFGYKYKKKLVEYKCDRRRFMGDLVSKATKDGFKLMMRDAPTEKYFVWFLPEGEQLKLAKNKPGSKWKLANPQAVPMSKTQEQVKAWIHTFVSKLPILNPKSESVNEAIHLASRSVAGKMARFGDPEWTSDPAQIRGIELGDSVAFAHAPYEEIGKLVGITGFKEAMIRTSTGKVAEYQADSLVKFRDAGSS